MWCVLISLFILTSYTISVVLRWGIPKSISQTFFSIHNKWIFSFVMAASFMLIAEPLIETLPSMWQWLGFLTAAGGLLIAFAPNLEDALEEQVHMTGAIIMGVASQLSVAMIYPHALGLWIMFLVFLPLKEKVFFAEIIGGVALYASLIIALS